VIPASYVNAARLNSDVKNLHATGYDAAYLQRWTRELGLDTLLEECLK